MTLVADRNDILQSRLSAVREVIRESFKEDLSDGYFYPVEPGTPLVRIQLAVTGYSIERRRNSRTANPWMPIVTADLAEFDAGAFRAWRSHYRMVES